MSKPPGEGSGGFSLRRPLVGLALAFAWGVWVASRLEPGFGVAAWLVGGGVAVGGSALAGLALEAVLERAAGRPGTLAPSGGAPRPLWAWASWGLAGFVSLAIRLAVVDASAAELKSMGRAWFSGMVVSEPVVDRPTAALAEVAELDGAPAPAATPAPDQVRTTFLLRLTAAGPLEGLRPARGTIRVTCRSNLAVVAGERWRVIGSVVQPRPPGNPGGFDFGRWLWLRGVSGVIRASPFDCQALDEPAARWPPAILGLRLRAFLGARLGAALPEPSRSLAVGLVLGGGSDLPDATVEAFRRTGLVHVLAASGSNVALLLAPLLGLAARAGMPRPGAVRLGLIYLVVYSLATGLPASVVRAAVMRAVVLVAELAQAKPDAGNALALAALAMLAWRPGDLLDAGFQLSFLATTGLLLWARPLTDRLGRLAWRGRGLPALAGELAGATLAAQLAVLPRQIELGQGVSLVSLLANLLLLPLVGWLVTASLLALLLAAVWTPLAWIPAMAVRAGGALFLGLSDWLAGLPGAWLAIGPPGPLQRTLLWGGLAAAMWATTDHKALARLRSVAAAARARAPGLHDLFFVSIGVIVGYLVVAAVRPVPLELVAIDVGQGDALLIRSPSGRTVLVDAGASDDGRPGALVDVLRRLGVRRIDAAVMTHAHADHAAGLTDVLMRLPVGRLVRPPDRGDADLEASIAAATRQQGISVIETGWPDQLDLGRGVRLTFLWPVPDLAFTARSEVNSRSLVAMLRYGRVRLLLAGDVEEEAEAVLLARYGAAALAADILKVAHHGSRFGTSEPFVQAVRPQLAVIGVGQNNRFGHPSPEVLDRLAAAGATVLRTDELGMIRLRTDGRRIWTRTFRPLPMRRAR